MFVMFISIRTMFIRMVILMDIYGATSCLVFQYFGIAFVGCFAVVVGWLVVCWGLKLLC